MSAAHEATNFLTELLGMADAFSRVFQGKYGLSGVVSWRSPIAACAGYANGH